MLLYRKHTEKIARDSYTPQNLKVQIGAIGLVVLALVAMLFSAVAIYLLAAAVLLLAISVTPFTLFALRRDVVVGVVAPFVLVLRSGAFATGLAYALARGAWK